MARTANASSQQEFEGDPIEVGCPMLIRAAAANPVDSARQFMRCALGWSVFDPLSEARCAKTHLVENCWREHPEMTPVVEIESVAEPVHVIVGKAAAD